MKAFVLIDGLNNTEEGYASIVIETEGPHFHHIAQVSVMRGQVTVSCNCGDDLEHAVINLEGSEILSTIKV